MSYIALARKWRPRSFSQLLGQDHVAQALTNSLQRQRLHHAYLFTGTRGVGKTSVARLLAKALNCEQGIQAEPCLQCDTCQAIEQAQFIDLIEVDGASKTRVEDMRDILENVQYAPAQGRFKIYLIDEVHMLSNHSFNALLKTLEEPPAHVKFLLATTDPQKLPLTILSRCLQFNLRHLPPEIIIQHLQHVLNDENLPFEPEALQLLANAAQGSMRDALSLLDQALASSQGSLTLQQTKNILGFAQQDYALQLLVALSELNASELIRISQQIAHEGGHFRYILEEILQHLHQLCILQTVPNADKFMPIESPLHGLAPKFTPEDTQLFYQIALKGIDEIQLAPTQSIGFEMTLLRMYTFRPKKTSFQPELAYTTKLQDAHDTEPVQQLPSIQERPCTADNIGPFEHSEATPEPLDDMIQINEHIIQEKNSVSADKQHIENKDKIIIDSSQVEHNDKLSWSNIIAKLKLHGLTQNAAANAELMGKEASLVILRVAKGHKSLFTSAVLNRLQEALTRFYHEPIKIKLIDSDEAVSSTPAQQQKILQQSQQKAAEEAILNDPFFQQLQQEFSGELVKNSIVSLKDDL